MHAAQHCLSCSDLGACWSQSFADVADVIFAQQSAFSICGIAACAGIMASGIETCGCAQPQPRCSRIHGYVLHPAQLSTVRDLQ